MSTRRKFNFPVATLTESARLFEAAITDPAYQPAMEARLTAGFITDFHTKITALTDGSTAQSGQTGDLSTLTEQQKKDLATLERLTAGAKRTAKLAFPGQTVLLHAEFEVGAPDSKSLAAFIAAATTIHVSSMKYSAELQAKGWLPADSTALDAAIQALSGTGTQQDTALGERLGLTNEKVIAANALYHDCLVIQNAARLAYPALTDAAGNAQNVTPRARFLLEEFPPRDRSQPDGGTQGLATPPPAPVA